MAAEAATAKTEHAARVTPVVAPVSMSKHFPMTSLYAEGSNSGR
jgi:hypothetical protein